MITKAPVLSFTPMSTIPHGIGPHEGRELDLLLSGEKKAALFADFITDDGTISEEIIPEKKFEPYINSGSVCRHQKEVFYPKFKKTYRMVVFTTPDEKWRAEALFWLREANDIYTDIIIGRLLGYTEEEIQIFLDHSENLLTGNG